MHHLFLVSQNCQVNLMEPKNLAIIFGPSVVRSGNETLETVVKDMKHQCRIVEALVSHVSILIRNSIHEGVFRLIHGFSLYYFQYEYFFENAEMPKVNEQTEIAPESTPRSQTNLLLDNVSKIECKFSDRIAFYLRHNSI